MAVSDSYVVEYLLQTTHYPGAAALWQEKGSGYQAVLSGVTVDLELIASRAGDRVLLSLSTQDRTVRIGEPPNLGFLHPRYATDDLARLAGLLRELAGAVTHLCAARRTEPSAAERQEIYQRLLFGPPAPIAPQRAPSPDQAPAA